MPNHNFFSAKLSSFQPQKSNNTLTFQPTVVPVVSIGKTYKPLTMLGLTFSLSSAAIVVSDWYQPAVALDLKSQNQEGNTFHQQPLLNVLEQFRIRLIPPLTPEKQATFAELPLLTTPKSDFDTFGTTTSLNFAFNLNSQPTLISQLSLLGYESTHVQSSKKIYTVQPGDSLSKIARKHHISVRELLKTNKIDNPDFISVGRKLNIPQTKSSQAIATEPISTLLSSDGVVKSFKQLDGNFASKLPSTNGTLANQTSKTSVDNNLQALVPSSGASDNPYIARLRADIEKLRDRYRTNTTNQSPANLLGSSGFVEPKVSTANSTNNPKTLSLATPWQSKPSLSNKKEFVSIAPLNTSNYQPAVPDNIQKTTTAAIIKPQLPPLPSSEEYLPTVFNGYSWPANGTLTSGYGWRRGRLHKGIDIAAPIGTPVFAAAPGEVIFSGWNSGGYGNLIKIKHPDSSITLYAHNNKNMVSKGQQIFQGQQIAEMGSTGLSTGPHLHFEIRANGNSAVNPMAFLNKK